MTDKIKRTRCSCRLVRTGQSGAKGNLRTNDTPYFLSVATFLSVVLHGSPRGRSALPLETVSLISLLCKDGS